MEKALISEIALSFQDCPCTLMMEYAGCVHVLPGSIERKTGYSKMEQKKKRKKSSRASYLKIRRVIRITMRMGVGMRAAEMADRGSARPCCLAALPTPSKMAIVVEARMVRVRRGVVRYLSLTSYDTHIL